jgi:peptidoglycan/xylan/chitin deacetylase (PgdA/CDA1 family)
MTSADAFARGSMTTTKRLLHEVLGSRCVTPVWVPLSRQRVSIFALHRFATPDGEVSGHDPALLRTTLERLRRERYTILSLEEAVRRLRERSGFPRCSVVFTVDDGYFDFGEVAAPVFAAFDAPVTVFVTTGFLDGTHWQWWDQIEHVFTHSSAGALSLEFSGRTLSVQLGNRSARASVASQIAHECTALEEAERQAFVDALSVAAGVEIPARPPARFAPMAWDSCRRLEKQGVSFGPHTVSHPVLIGTSASDAEWQIAESWNGLRQRVARPLPILAYPNGDYGAREMEITARAGLEGAVTTEPAYATSDGFHAPDGNFSIPRFPYPDYPAKVCLTAAGFMRVSAAVRRAFAAVR